MLLGLERFGDQVAISNVGSEDQVDVKTIARIVIEEMDLKSVKLTFTGVRRVEEDGEATSKTRCLT
jgi:hypothetical protein